VTTWTIAPEEQDILWQAILARVEELVGNMPHGRSQGYYAAFGSRGHCRCITTVHNDDGTITVYDLEATRNSEYPADKPWGKVAITVRTYRDDNDDFWQKRFAEYDDLSVVVNHEHYRIVPDKPGGPDHCRGFGGREFTIAFADGRTVTTRNLWHQGVIPPSWRDRLPDNAVFVWPEQKPLDFSALQDGSADL
jgi:hypothetical protein